MDILIGWNPAQLSGDWLIENGSLGVSSTGSDDLKTAVMVSLFSWRVAPAGYVGPNGDTDPKGWWGDSYEASPIGSRLWMLLRAKKSSASDLKAQAQKIITEALQWLIDDGVAASVKADAFWITNTALGITVSIRKPSGQTFGYSWTWKGF